MSGSSSGQQGFALSTILVLSVTIIIVLSGLLGAISSIYRGNPRDHYQAMSDQAAEAGTAYATSCLTLNSRNQTWGNTGANSLKPVTDCTGATKIGYPSTVYSDATVRTTFEVGNLDFSLQNSVQISALGKAEVLAGDGSVVKTYTSVRKKVITWPNDYIAQSSASGTNRTCVVMSGSVYCWGYGAYGQLGNGVYGGASYNIEKSNPGYDSTTPVKVKQDPGMLGGKKVVKIMTAQYHSCALTTNGMVYCWGRNSSGQLGNGTNVDSAVPVKVNGLLAGKVVTDIGGTSNVSCAIAEGKIYCWGEGYYGAAGIGTTPWQIRDPTLVSATNTATTLPTNYNATALATSGSRSRVMCAIVSGKPYCWGQNEVGSIGDGTSGNVRTVPTKVVDTGALAGKTVVSISQDGSILSDKFYPHVCAVTSDGGVYCWGDNQFGQVGTGGVSSSVKSPVRVNSLSTKFVDDVKVGLRHSCVLASAEAYCWGYNVNGQSGTGSASMYVLTPNKLGFALTGKTIIAIGAGANRGCAVIDDGRTFCWGLNSAGQIGDGTLINRYRPTESLFLRPVGNQYIY